MHTSFSMMRPLGLALAVLLGGCGEEPAERLDPYRAPPAPPRPGCRTTDVVAIPVGNNPGLAAFDEALASGRVPAEWEVESNQVFGDRSFDIEGACCDDDLCVKATLASVPDLAVPGPNTVIQVSLVTGLEAQERPEAARTIVVTVDASGSLLSRQRIGFVKDALHEMIDRVEEDALIGLVAFDAQARVLVPVGPRSEMQDAAHAAIDDLRAGGGTNLWSGLQAAFIEADRVFDPTREHRVLLVTDGNDPRGQQDAELISRDLLPFHSRGIQLTVFGVGGEEEQAWLRPLTEGSDGRFLEDDGAENLPGLVMEELSRRYVPVATDVELRIRPPDSAVLANSAGWAPPVRGDGILRAQLSAVLLGPEGEMVTPGQSVEGGPAVIVDLEPGLETESPGEADVVLNYNPVGASSRQTFRAYVDLPADWPAVSAPITEDPAAREALYARHLGDGLIAAIAQWFGGDRGEAIRLITQVEAMAEDYPDLESGTDPDVNRDRNRVNQLRRRMEGLSSSRPEVTVPEDPWPGAP